jgi:hypothetical protein
MTAVTTTAVMTAMTAAAAVVAATTLMTLTTTGTTGTTTRRMPAGRGGGWRRGGRGSRRQRRRRQRWRWRRHLWNSLAIEKDAEARLPRQTMWRRLVVPSRMIATVPVVPPRRWHVAVADWELIFIVVVVPRRGQGCPRQSKASADTGTTRTNTRRDVVARPPTRMAASDGRWRR